MTDHSDVTEAEVEAARKATGYSDVDRARVAEACEEWGGLLTRDLRRELKTAEEEFVAGGSRGVELAERIDGMRIALAVRGV